MTLKPTSSPVARRWVGLTRPEITTLTGLKGPASESSGEGGMEGGRGEGERRGRDAEEAKGQRRERESGRANFTYLRESWGNEAKTRQISRYGE